MLDPARARKIRAAIDTLVAVKSQVVTHGDRGSGNYLDDGGVGVILDWETASVSPFGLDAGRAAFIALMDLGHTGVPVQLHRAFIRGYWHALCAPGLLDDKILEAATTVAGLQFIHGRVVQPLRADRTPQMAADVLRTYLNQQSASGAPA